ncbi:peptidoglycan bridge formation glycyltransferase FemA/FemB family protein [Streptococcus parasanguinis]|uniref:Peptidoglycan bridge formation glycyltransferase FemA/FemB family protein n=1 Tax=Streptococcus parasanguinis TaxID=1318 RepID=A0A7X3BNP0_STRPA|nr:aminoacyltransferase [Streptococcus parasanguinis]MTS53581.1 peptidoglycan bridge formation glycyltransferase FemA/FemB family protein [Streptococcus parasanguinis]RYS59019.1 aminoacyltransferase [Streptococcus parasanguinis]
MTLTTISKEEFTSFANTVSHRSFIQSAEMADLLEKRGNTVQFIAWKQENQVQVVAILYSLPMTGGLHMEINSGPLYQEEAMLEPFYAALKDYTKENGAIELVIKPYDTYQTFDSDGNPTSEEQTHFMDTLKKLGYQHDGLTTGYPGGEPVWHYLKNVNGVDSKSLLKSFNKNCSRNITTALNYDISIRNITREEIPQFKQIIEETGKRQGFEDKSLSYYYDLYDSFGPNAEFVVAEINSTAALTHLDQKISLLNPSSKQYEQQLQKLEKQKNIVRETLAGKESETVPLACALIIYTPSEVTYLFGGSYTKYQKFSAAFLIQYHAMNRALEEGITLYNFLGIQGIFDGSDGVLRFKQNFNGYIVRKMGTFRYYPSPLKYKMISLIKKLLGRS